MRSRRPRMASARACLPDVCFSSKPSHPDHYYVSHDHLSTDPDSYDFDHEHSLANYMLGIKDLILRNNYNLALIYAAQGKPASAIHACEQALKLEASPQQRLRLRLTLGERLAASGHDPEAYEDYQKLLAENPDYPDKPAIYRKLLPLAQKLNKTADAERYEAELKK